MSGGWAVEFEFVEDDSGEGKFVSAGSATAQISTLVGRGEVERAARVFEELGAGSTGATLLEEAKVASVSTRKNLAQMFLLARDFASSAKVNELLGKTAEAAALYEQALDFVSAARCHQTSGDAGKAAAALERSGDLDQAAKLYKDAGATDSLAECLVRQGRFAEAAAVYHQLGNVHAEVEMLRQVPVNDPHRLGATFRLASLMEQYGHAEKAVAVIDATFRELEAARKDARLQGLLVRLLESLGRSADAAKVKAALGLTGAGPSPDAPAPRQQDHASEDYAHLKAIPIFSGLSLPDMRDLYRVAQEIQYPKGSAIIEQGQASSGLTVITDGKVDVATTVNGTARLLNELAAGAYVGEIGLVRDAPASARVIAKGPVRALFISKPAFEHYLYEHPTAATAIYRLFSMNLAERVQALSERS